MLMVYKTPEVQSDVAGRGTHGRSPWGTPEQRRPGTNGCLVFFFVFVKYRKASFEARLICFAMERN